jgi:hypothetical protein
MRLRAILLALALAACGQPAEKQAETPAAPEQPDPFNLNIEIGRYGVMLSHVQQLTRERPGSIEAEVTDPRDLARRLRETAWEYNLERSRLCARGLFTEVSCGPAYEPVWMSEPATATPTLQEIQSRANSLGEEVSRFWNVVCSDARSRTEGEEERMFVCAIE